MGKLNLTALRVRQTAINQLTAGKIKKLPQWVDVLGDVPPTQVLVRNQPPQHQLIRQRVKSIPTENPGVTKQKDVFEVQEKPVKSKKGSRMFQPVQIKYEEDQLRKEFFRDHPWELARPRVLVETTGKDFEQHNWEKLQQPGKKLDGESVVQRQLHLLNNVSDITKSEAYDIARREFYRLRLQQDIERRVAAEEAEATGAVFGPRQLDIGMELENQQFDQWKDWAKLEAQFQEQRAASFTGAPTGAREEEEEAGAAEEEKIDLAAKSPTPAAARSV